MIQFRELIQLWNLMKENGVVLYGAGKNAEFAIEVLYENMVKVYAVADKIVGKQVKSYEAISLDKLCDYNCRAIAIVTVSPRIDCSEEKAVLAKHFSSVIDMTVLRYAKYMIPNEESEFDYTCLVPFNHYESPYPTLQEVEFHNLYISETEKYMNINLHIPEQLDFLKIIKKEIGNVLDDNIHENLVKTRFQSNSFFDGNDAVLLYVMLMNYRPKRIIEIGSGYSTCIMLDVNEFKLNETMNIKCIEPYPERLFSRIRENEERLEVRKNMIQMCPLEEFRELEKNDILFIDSSHVTKSGGDIPYEYFNILPQLQSGVIIHIHDIFYPFVYPENWIKQGRAYTEAYVLRALLENNDDYEILFWNDMMQKKYSGQYKSVLPDQSKFWGCSLWLRKR